MNILLLAAALPPLFLVYQIYKMDSVEKEPPGLLVKLLIFGGLITFAASIIEGIFSPLFGSPPLSYWTSQIISNFIVIALTEELCKFFVLKILTWKNREFNYTFDGIVYAVVVSLGFALVENVLYTFAFGIHVAAVRAFTAIVAHAVFGVIMGTYYGEARKAASSGSGAAKPLMVKGIVMAAALHGVYDLTASQDEAVFQYVFLALVAGMYIITYRRVKKAQLNDTPVYDTDFHDETDFRGH